MERPICGAEDRREHFEHHLRKNGFSEERLRSEFLMIARQLTGNPDRAEDLAQNALLRVYRYCYQFKGISSFETWAKRILFREFLQECRRDKRRPLLSDDYEDPVHNPHANEHVNRRQTLGNLDDLASKSISVRTLVEIKGSGLTQQEYADAADLPISTVRARVKEGMKVVRRDLETSTGESYHDRKKQLLAR